nr:MAG TPA: hypothetical protein [Bacteriophage sp.]
MADLKTNYVDDVLDTTKNQLRKYQQIQNDDGTVSFVDVTEYTQVGTSFGAKDINDTNAAINDVNGKLTKITHYSGITANNQYVVNSNNSAIIDDYIFINVTINGTIPTSWTDIATLDDAVNYTAVVGMLQGINGVARIEIKSNKIIAQGLSSGGGVSFCAMCKKSNTK